MRVRTLVQWERGPVFGGSPFGWSFFAQGPWGALPRPPLIVRIAGYLDTFWETRKPESNWEDDIPGEDWEVGKPV